MRTLSILLTTTMTGLPLLRSMSATSSSSAVRPWRPSTKKRITSHVSTAISAWRRICVSSGSSLRGSIPPVSMSVNLWFCHSQSAYTRSRVTPGVSSTMAMRLPAIWLKKVDLPTFGRPTIATNGLAICPPPQSPGAVPPRSGPPGSPACRGRGRLAPASYRPKKHFPHRAACTP